MKMMMFWMWLQWWKYIMVQMERDDIMMVVGKSKSFQVVVIQMDDTIGEQEGIGS